MKSIKYKIMVSFCITAAVIIMALGLLISSKLSAGIEGQSKILSADLIAMTNKTLVGYHRVFELKVSDIMAEMERIAIDISRHSGFLKNTEDLRVTALTGILEGSKVHMDFVALFDLKGHHLASSPSDIGDDVDVAWIEKFYQSSELWKRVQETLKSGSEANLRAVTKHDADFIKAFKLTENKFTGSGFISYTSAKIVKGDFGDPLAVLIIGKMLNNYDRPLKEFYDSTGLACAIYAGTGPIAHMGFGDAEKQDNAVSKELQISMEILKEIYGADQPKTISLTLAGKDYITTSSAITDSNGKKVGIISVGMPRQKVVEIEQRFLSHGIASKRNLQAWILGIGVISILVFVIVSLFISTGIVRPIKQITHTVKQIAAGDLTITIPSKNRSDELGTLTDGFNKMLENLRSQTQQMTGGANTLASSISQISATASQLAANSSETSSSVSEITTTVEEVRQTAQVSSEKAKEVADSAEAAFQTSEEGKKATEESFAGMNRTKEEMEYIAEAIMKLSEQTQSIGEIISSVTDLADQSNLLSVNASIEAAKAGEQGKGFAVVAQEVKSLADQSKEATNQVRSILSDIQKATGTAVMATERGSKTVEMGVALAAKAGDAIALLADSVARSAESATQIAASSQQQLVGMDQLAQAMDSIKDASLQNVDATKQLEGATRTLTDLGHKLKEVSGKSKT